MIWAMYPGGNTNLSAKEEIESLKAKIEQLTSQINAIKKSTTVIWITNLKAAFDACPIGMAPASTTEASQGLPDPGSEWLYCSGFVTKRDNQSGNVFIFSRMTGKIAVASTVDSGETWTEWFIK